MVALLEKDTSYVDIVLKGWDPSCEGRHFMRMMISLEWCLTIMNEAIIRYIYIYIYIFIYLFNYGIESEVISTSLIEVGYEGLRG